MKMMFRGPHISAERASGLCGSLGAKDRQTLFERGVEGAGVRRLSEYEPILSQLLTMMAKDTSFEAVPSLNDVFSRHPRVIVVLNHSTPLSWLPSVALLAIHACARGCGDRVPMGVMDRFFFQIPFLREVAQLITQVERPLSFRELCERFEDKGDIDLVLFPEGSNCFFGHPEEIQEFRSPKFVELAVRTGAPILIGVHTGSEAWARALPVPDEFMQHLKLLPRFAFDFLEKRVRKSGLFVLPLLPVPMEKFSMRTELYRPRLKFEDLASDAIERAGQIRVEAERIRARMREMLLELRSRDLKRITGETSVNPLTAAAREELACASPPISDLPEESLNSELGAG